MVAVAVCGGFAWHGEVTRRMGGWNAQVSIVWNVGWFVLLVVQRECNARWKTKTWIGTCTISVLGVEVHGWVQRCYGDARALTWSCRVLEVGIQEFRHHALPQWRIGIVKIVLGSFGARCEV